MPEVVEGPTCSCACVSSRPLLDVVDILVEQKRVVGKKRSCCEILPVLLGSSYCITGTSSVQPQFDLCAVASQLPWCGLHQQSVF